MPKKADPKGKETKPAGPKPQQEKPKAQKSPKKDAGEPAKARRAARQMGEQQAQRAAKPDEKKAQKAAKPDDRKKAQKAGKPDEQKKARKAAKPDEQKKVQRDVSKEDLENDEMPVQLASASGTGVHVADGKDAYEREAKQVGADVAAGQEISPRRIGASTRGAARAAKDDEPARKAAKPEETKTAQKLEAPTTPAATLPPTAAQTPDEVASNAIRTKGSGVPLAPGTRALLEEKMGVNLGRVRVHDDSAARTAAEGINARAFTHGYDIWLGPGESQSDIALMAHEVTHVLQQARGAGESLVQRETAAPKPKDETPGAEPTEWDYVGESGKIKKDDRISIPTLNVPKFKMPPIPPGPLTLAKKTGERKTKQIEVWEGAAGKSEKLDKAVAAKAAEESPAAEKNGEPAYFLELPAQNFFVIGTLPEIKQRLLRPFWNQAGERKPMQVDHRHEYQLRQPNQDADDINNLWLLDAATNQSSGNAIAAEKQKKIETVLADATKAQEKKPPKGKKAAATEAPAPDPGDKSVPIFDKQPSYKEAREKYFITFEKVEPKLAVRGPIETWELNEIKDEAKQVEKLKALTKRQIAGKGLKGTKSSLAIYISQTGGSFRKVPWKVGETKQSVALEYGKKGEKRSFAITALNYDENQDPPGTVDGVAFEGFHLLKTQKFEGLPLHRMELVDYGGFIPPAAVTAKFKELNIPTASPVEMQFIELTDKGLVGRGQLLPTIPLIRDIGIDVILNGTDVYLSKTFSADEFKFPGPITVTASSLEIFAGTNGVGARGDVDFEIARLGKGHVEGLASTQAGFGVKGGFDFDSELFDPASIKVAYQDGKFSGEGEIGIPEGKVRGIKSAHFKASFDDDKIDAEGTVKPNIPGVEQGNLEFHYAPETGMVIGGRLDLRKDIPGVEGGYVEAELSRPPDAPEWSVKAKGEAKPKIPGLNTTIAITYDNGIFDANGTTSFEKGMVKGAVQIGITNRQITPEGTPGGAPDEKSNTVTIYGGGAVTMRIAPWLEGTAGIRILPNGEIEVVGKIALPSTLDLFPEKRFDKNIFKIGIDIPIVGVAVAGQRIGIFANITGGLDLSAGIGPGQLQDVFLSVTYNPAHEDQTHVQGGAKLHIPADAGLRLFVRGGLGVGIPVVSAQAGLEIGGQLGLEGALDAAVEVDWMPSKGLKIDALGSVYVQPKFTFDITGFVLVEADLWVTTIELYSKKWKFASFSYGSDLRFGLKFPIHYEEGKPFDVSLSDVQFELPNVDPMSTLKGLIAKIA